MGPIPPPPHSPDSPSSSFAPRGAAPAPRPLALLFDLDGTLADSVALILGAFRYTFVAHLGAAPPDEAWIRGMGTPLATQLRELVRDDTLVEPMLATYRDFQRQHHDALLREFAGVRETLALLHARAHPMAVVTSKSNEMAERALTRLGLAPFIRGVIGVDSCRHHKPHPEPVHLALRLLDYPAAHALLVGDSPHDIAAGNAAGVTTVAALWGPFDAATLEATHPSHLIRHITELPSLVERLTPATGTPAP